MAQLSDTLRELKEIKNGAGAVEEIREIVKSTPKFDTTEITGTLQAALLSLFNTQNINDEERKSKILGSLKESEKYVMEVASNQEKIISGLEVAVMQIQSSIDSISIPEMDLSGIEKSIQGSDSLEKQIKSLSRSVAELKNIKPIEIDLSPILEAIKNIDLSPRKVKFEVSKYKHGMPVEVTATEIREV